MIISDKLFSEKIPKEIQNEKVWTIGLSGGADSFCLTMLANDYAKVNGINLLVCIVDHRLRKESSTEILPVIKILRKNNIDHKVLVWEHTENINGNIELKARIARYDLLYDFCKKSDCRVLMTAHHALDQWETFFMRLSRGSSVKGLSCIKQISELKDIQLIRPLLDFTPLDTQETLEKKFGIKEYVNDPFNNSPKFERTKWRNAYQELSGKYNLSITSIDKAIKRIQSANDCLDKIAKYNTSEIFDGTYIDITKFKELYHELKTRVLNIVIETISPKGKQIVSYNLLEKVATNICKKDFTATNLSGVVLRRDCTKNIKVYTENRVVLIG